MNTIQLFANRLDVTLLQTALDDLAEKVALNNDFYGVADNITDLLSQLQSIKENN